VDTSIRQDNPVSLLQICPLLAFTESSSSTASPRAKNSSGKSLLSLSLDLLQILDKKINLDLELLVTQALTSQ
jgi:hypothetical protein